MLSECPALPDLRAEFSALIPDCSGAMARLVWARSPCSAGASLHALECYADDKQTLHPFSTSVSVIGARDERVSFLPSFPLDPSNLPVFKLEKGIAARKSVRTRTPRHWFWRIQSAGATVASGGGEKKEKPIWKVTSGMGHFDRR